MMLFRCFRVSRGQSSNRHTYEFPERNMQMDSHISTVSFNYPVSPASRMLDFSTSLTPEGLPVFTQTFKQPKIQMQSRITSPKRVIIVNPGSTKCLGQQNRTKTTSTITQ
ncbi:AC4 protein [Vigna yellow mosaic virus]|uniref:AC4 protein n=1 Tax=Vigna yellow mosaic virus TaxID=1312724 RepID=M4YDU3_9GEMI|nr:AC4 protein [Vigna yellow mosaic virus]AGI42769.1 AC4 protein [Vigna yellow mosaic virus]